MRSWILAVLWGLVVLPGAVWGFEAQAVVRSVEPEKRTIVVLGGGGEVHSVKVAADAKILDEKGAPLADGLKSAELKAGVHVTLTIEPAGNEPVVHGIQLGKKVDSGGAPGEFKVLGLIRKIDAKKRSIGVFAGGQERTVDVTADAKILDEKGAPLEGGLTSSQLKSGVEVTLNVDPSQKPPVIRGIQLGKHTGGQGQNAPRQNSPPLTGKPSVGLKPLTEMTASDNYKGQDGGLYGGGSNEPPAAHRAAARKETAKIVPLDAQGQPSPSGTIGLISISMSNATMEFSKFKQIADGDPAKSSLVTIADCAQGGQAMAQWTAPDARPWAEAEQRLQRAGVTPQQVQIAWIKLANVGPTGELADHGKKLQSDTLAVLQNSKKRFPYLRIAYLSSRIYAGYAGTRLNPEPYAYEGAFPVRWLIQDQIKGTAELNYDPEQGAVKAPLLLWGPYLWADGITPRKSDALIYERQDLASDGTHPSESGRIKVANQLLAFFKTDAEARTWFLKK